MKKYFMQKLIKGNKTRFLLKENRDSDQFLSNFPTFETAFLYLSKIEAGNKLEIVVNVIEPAPAKKSKES